MKNSLKFAIAVTVPLAVGALSGVATASGVSGWYKTLAKPVWNPPNAVFAPVWTVLYILMGIALFLVWKSAAPMKIKRPAITFWIGQLALNATWSFLFFYQQQIGFALLEIGLLWIAILITIFCFARISKTAAWLLVPYISWVSFAAILNYAIWQLNK